MSRCAVHVWPRSVQGQSSRLNIVWLYFMSALYLLNPLWDFQITLHKCQVWCVDVQYICLTKVGSRSRSGSTLNIVWLNFMSALYLLNPEWDFQITLHKCQVWWVDVQCMFDQGHFKVKFKVKHCMTVFYVCSVSFEPLVGFSNNSSQMSSMMSWCAMRMFDQGRFKVKVIVQRWTLYNCISCPLYIFWTPCGIFK